MRVLIPSLVALMLYPPPAQSLDAKVTSLHARAAGSDLEALQRDVTGLAALARRHVRAVGLEAALADFGTAPWKRKANGLHLWGVTTDGLSWFDAGHPDMVGTNVNNITDIEGRFWAALAKQSADGTGETVFSLLFLHPETGRSARGLHTCFFLDDGKRILCAGAFQDDY
ncbi:hypothetical protein [Stappia indica]|uniref:hypothetical protein n=1 Tax=Stappia indica TaxID=538381 RepID=UPI001CD57F27|nr:hypothetical protein [Stappia indica]MCA1297141.1 hypothetical protein [Stappia indica]